MQKLLATGKTDLLQFVSSRTRRPFSAFLVRQTDGKVGFEFEAKDPTKAPAAARRPSTALRVLGAHPADGAPVELHAGATVPTSSTARSTRRVPDRDKVDTLTLEEARGAARGQGRQARRPPAPRGPPPSRRARAGEDAAAKAAGEEAGDREDRRRAKAAARRPRRSAPAARQGSDDRRPRRRPPPSPRRASRRHRKARRARDARHGGGRRHRAAAQQRQATSTRSTALRGFAVLLVFCVHAAGNAAAIALGTRLRPDAASRRSTPPGARAALLAARVAPRRVPLLRAVGLPDRPHVVAAPTLPYATFAWRRTLRIYPAFLLSFAASLAFAYASRHVGAAGRAAARRRTRCSSTARRDRGIVPFNIVTWSLFYEMTFYFAFPRSRSRRCRGAARRRARCGRSGSRRPWPRRALGADAMVLCWSLLFVGVALAVHEAPLRRVRRARARARRACSRISP